ncbi:MAG: NAD-dependent epimerase/dehydratase family protein, partial [Alphaproteobacteria bacterium]|nr:NAD-dependent epimerase/dehydratase family protein [Alphaproteobacteria bacterium]
TGPLEPTNEAYALAKIAGLKLCEAYRRQHGKAFFAAMPCNLYGPGDTFDAARSHVIPALILTLTAAARTGKDSVTLWGTGAPLREFLFGDDLAAALVFLLDCADPPDLINIGSGKEITIRDLAGMIASLVGYEGEILFDSSKPDGTPRKIVDSARIRAMGWRPDTSLAEGLRQTIDWYRRNFRVE